METIENIVEDIMLVKTKDDVIAYRGSLFNATRKWWHAKKEKVKQADYVMAIVDNIVREVYKPDKRTWHLEIDTGKDILSFPGDRWVFGIQDDSDDGEYCKSMLAPDSIRKKYIGKKLGKAYQLTNQLAVRYSF